MALDGTYAGLKASLAAMMDVSATDLSGVIADIVALGESRVLREVKTKDNEEPLSGTITSGVIAVPADYMSLKFAYIDASEAFPLERRSPEWIYANCPMRSASSRPKYIARDGASFIFGPYPDSGYTVIGSYYKRAGTLASATYDLFTNNQDLFFYACLSKAEIAIGRDARIAVWESEYQRTLNTVNGMDRAEGSSGSTLQIRVG